MSLKLKSGFTFDYDNLYGEDVYKRQLSTYDFWEKDLPIFVRKSIIARKRYRTYEYLL